MLMEKVSVAEQAKKYLYQAVNCMLLNEKIEIPFLVISVGQACSLKCKDCANFSPYAPEPYRQYDMDETIECLNKILSIGSIKCIQIQGGEPFCHPELNKLLLAISKNQLIRIATNGTIVPNPELCKTMKSRNIQVRISDYNVPGYEEKVKRFISCMQENHITYTYYHFTTKFGKWQDCGGMETPREADDRVVNDRYWTCSFRTCLTLENAMIGYCSRSIIAPAVQKINYKIKDYILLKKYVGGLRLKLRFLNYIYAPHYMECCRYCYGMEGELIDPAIQLESKKSGINKDVY